MGVSTQDRTDFLNMLDGCRTEQQLFSRLTFAVMFHQTDPDAREDLLDDVINLAYADEKTEYRPTTDDMRRKMKVQLAKSAESAKEIPNRFPCWKR